MIKVIKYAADGTFPDSRRKGNFLVGESTVAYGPTSTTGFYNGITPPEGGYTLYLAKETQGPSIFVFNTGTELLDFCNSSLGSEQSTIFGVIDWINEQSNYFVDPNYFEFTAKTDNSGVSSSTQFKLPLISSGSINFTSFMAAKTAATYSASNLDSIYNNWSQLTLTSNININFGSAKYNSTSQSGRNVLTSSPNNWTITDGGQQ